MHRNEVTHAGTELGGSVLGFLPRLWCSTRTGDSAVEWTKLWLPEPEEHDFPAAADYLGLLLETGEVKRIIDALRTAPTQTKKAKDIMRASALPLLPADNIHVKRNIQKVNSGKKLSPYFWSVILRWSSPTATTGSAPLTT